MDFSTYPIRKDIPIFYYDLKETTDDRLLTLTDDPRQNPFLPLKPPPTRQQAAIQLIRETRDPRDEYPRVFEAVITDAPPELISMGIPLHQKVAIEIYDPDVWFDHGVTRADNAFLHTAACYMKLKHLQGEVIPRYYGSFILKLPCYFEENSKIEVVPGVIREFVDGTYLDKLKHCPTEKRQAIMEKVIEAEKKVDDGGVGLDYGRHPQGYIVDESCGLRVVSWLFPFSGLNPKVGSYHSCPGALPYTLVKWTEFSIKRDYSFGKFVNWPWRPWLLERYGYELPEILQEYFVRIPSLREELFGADIDSPPALTDTSGGSNSDGSAKTQSGSVDLEAYSGSLDDRK